jgi:Protein of unknown function (DUF4238)
MPAHKNQHFVPRCALKPFSLDGSGKAINLFNIKSKRSIENAPVKGQCARDYLYAKEDLEAEQLLAKMEGQYARIVALLSDARVLSDDDVGALKFLVLIQSRRTELAIQRIRDFTKSMADTVYARAPDQKPIDTSTDRQLMYLSMRMAARAVDYIRDLKLVIFRNKTAIDFVTCDNPATMTNRFHFQKLKSNKFGLSNSGAMFSMPLSPRLSAMCYDTGTYSVPNASGTQFVDLTKDADATGLNQLQYLSASKNIYFRNWSDAERIKSELESFADKRAQAAPTTRIYVRDDFATSVVGRLRDPKTGKMEKYRQGTPEEEQTARETIAATSFEFAEPFIWPSKLKFRDKPKCYHNGTAVGYVRKAEWLRKGGKL